MPQAFLHSEITYKIRGCCFEVFNALGSGQKEKVYHQALKREFTDQHLPFVSEPKIEIAYKDERVGVYKPDFVVDNKVLIELKSLPVLPTAAYRQFGHYLKSTPFEVGLLINFGQPQLSIHRKVWFNNAL